MQLLHDPAFLNKSSVIATRQRWTASDMHITNTVFKFLAAYLSQFPTNYQHLNLFLLFQSFVGLSRRNRRINFEHAYYSITRIFSKKSPTFVTCLHGARTKHTWWSTVRGGGWGQYRNVVSFHRDAHGQKCDCRENHSHLYFQLTSFIPAILLLPAYSFQELIQDLSQSSVFINGYYFVSVCFSVWLFTLQKCIWPTVYGWLCHDLL